MSKKTGGKMGENDVPKNAKEGRAVQKDDRAMAKASQDATLTPAQKLKQAIEEGR
jgi:nucleoid DNA-binding protein